MEKKILVRFGELTLKSDRSRRRFLSRLINNIQDALNNGKLNYKIENLWSRLLIEVDDIPRAVDILRRVFGIHSIAVVYEYYYDGFRDLIQKGVELYKDRVLGKTFAVRARRVGIHNFTSMDIARELGAELYKYSRGVDLKNPEVVVKLEVRYDRVFYYDILVNAYGGLPIGTQGVAVALVSGGFDSAIAAWYTLKRGAIVHYIFCNLDGEGYKMDVINVVKVLADNWSYGYKPKLYIIDFTKVVDEIKKTRMDYWNVILKRMMYRAAENFAKKLKAETIITGESLGQVSSQTLTNLMISQEVVSIPINRPLFGFDKEEIMNVARDIGTYDYSAKVQEYCAIIPKRPILRASRKVVESEEKKIDFSVLEKALANVEVIDLRSYGLKPADEYGVNELIDGYRVIDIRDKSTFDKWHVPGAENIPAAELKENPEKYLDRDDRVILYCEKGVLARQLAHELRRLGYKNVYYFIYGLPKLRKICESIAKK